MQNNCCIPRGSTCNDMHVKLALAPQTSEFDMCISSKHCPMKGSKKGNTLRTLYKIARHGDILKAAYDENNLNPGWI
jgi:hypothetical protein